MVFDYIESIYETPILFRTPHADYESGDTLEAVSSYTVRPKHLIKKIKDESTTPRTQISMLR